uniref:Gypsy retrotransposon integrase-like protein 1 n=1 Tax=Gouania willdenowi TaxID=441366 RepID=A0A8C5HQZ8_GOUWI
MDSDSAVVCSVESPQPDSPSDSTPPPVSCAVDQDQALVYALSHDGSSLRELQRQDADVGQVLAWLEEDLRPPRWRLRGASRGLKKLWHEFPRLKLVDGLLYRTVYLSEAGLATQVVVPSTLVPEVLQLLHGAPLTAHLAHERVLARARAVCYWPYMHTDILAWCEQCYACQRRKSPVPNHQAPMRTSQSERPFQRVAADILELPVTSGGNRYVLVVEDYFSKFVNLYAISDQRAATVAERLFKDYVLEHGVMETLHTDMGRQFESEVVKHLCCKLGVRKTHTTPYHPKSDGMVERFNRTLIDQLAKTLLSCEGEWDCFLSEVAFAYNTSVHSSTGFTPYFLTHGREARTPVDVLLGPSGQPYAGPVSLEGFVESLLRRLETAFGLTRDNNFGASLKQKTFYDSRMRHEPYEVGDLVWLNDPTESRRKLAPHWKGPYLVQARLDTDGMVGVTYRINSPFAEDPPHQTVHYNRLRRYGLPAAVPMAGSSESGHAPSMSPVLQELVTPHGSPGAVPLPGSAGGGGMGQVGVSPGSPVPALGKVSRAGRQSRVPTRFRDYVLE